MTAPEQLAVHHGLDRDELVHHLKECSILTPDEIDRVAEKHPGATREDLVCAFVDAGLLTNYQINAIAGGKQAELRIGNYDVLDRLGAGGMGTVFKARHRHMKRIVALKVLAKNLSQDDTFVQRFQREVETIAQLSHPNVVMAYDADEADVGHFLVMEFVNGQDLAGVVQHHGPMSVLAAVECILGAARGLAYAHGQNIIHRDIKPANLLRDANGTVKVTDLGLARLNTNAIADSGATAAHNLTQAGGILGTADYMPPEQAVDATTIDHRADIYSLGATLYFLLTGQSPYAAPSMMAILIKHREAPIPSLCEARKDVPVELDELFRCMLAKDPNGRPQAMTQVVSTLESVLKNLGVAPAAPITGTVAHPERPTDAGQSLAMTKTGVASEAHPAADVLPAAKAIPSVLLVEPSRTQAGIIRKYLQSLDLTNIVSVATGAEALAAIHANCPDVIVTAMHLNDMTGTQLARQVREERRTAQPGFVLISSESAGTEAGMLSQSGHAAMLHKPFTAESLMHALKLASNHFANLKPSTPSMAAPKPQTPNRSQYRVLIVDDSATARRHVRNVLAALSFTQFTEAADGAQAVAVVAREKFDLIVTDYNMPLMDGCGFVGYLRQNPATASVPIIMVTTETEPSKLDPVRALGVTICEKSFPVDTARRIIDTLIEKMKADRLEPAP